MVNNGNFFRKYIPLYHYGKILVFRNPETRISSSRPPSPTATAVAIQPSTTIIGTASAIQSSVGAAATAATATAAAGEESSQAEDSYYGTSGGVHIPKTGFDFLDDW